MTDCPFCLDANPEMNDLIEWSTTDWYMIEPVGAVSTGHRLLIPTRHIEAMEQLVTYELVQIPGMIETARRMTGGSSQYNLAVNCGADAGQTVFHLHLHFVARNENDGLYGRGGMVGHKRQFVPLGPTFDGGRFD